MYTPANNTLSDKPSPGIRIIQWFEIFVPGIFLILFIVLACMSGVYWREVHQHSELFEPPYSPNIKPGTYMPFIAACIGVAFFLLSIFIPHSRIWWLACTITRFALAMSLVASTVLQSHYLPLPLGSCKNKDVWRDSAGVEGGLPTIFEVLPTYQTKSKSGKHHTHRPCDTLLTIWRFEIALA
ncbi:hypothetical protein N7456_013695 [Penicillium angulare]|uniref:Uncharacterized protein n=1 Tax=Penicillium angulare TaxID=116970 RepID=A0A9W9JT68_9EURO|nr:hypothetical protein N7456_013695 [Penicillium angulare]